MSAGPRVLVVSLLLMEALLLNTVHTFPHLYAGPRVLVVSLLLMESVLLRLVQDPVSQANTIGMLVDPTGRGGGGGGAVLGLRIRVSAS